MSTTWWIAWWQPLMQRTNEAGWSQGTCGHAHMPRLYILVLTWKPLTRGSYLTVSSPKNEGCLHDRQDYHDQEVMVVGRLLNCMHTSTVIETLKIPRRYHAKRLSRQHWKQSKCRSRMQHHHQVQIHRPDNSIVRREGKAGVTVWVHIKHAPLLPFAAWGINIASKLPFWFQQRQRHPPCSTHVGWGTCNRVWLMQTCEFRRSYVGRYMHEYGGQTGEVKILESQQNSKGTNGATYGL
jgi:hypothetical protein